MHTETRENWDRLPLTVHARRRMAQRGIGLDAVSSTLRHGRCVHVRGAWVHVVGRLECKRARRNDLDLSAFEGVHVVCGSDGVVLTVFRNQRLALRDTTRRR